MAYGTDTFFAVPGETRGTLAMSYIDSFVEAGVTPKDILQIMTINAARLLGVDKQRGALKVGMAADLIATTQNPLTDIQTLKKVQFVMKDGKVFKKP
jgi:imidazolonepropionase-like amidohydrolase